MKVNIRVVVALAMVGALRLGAQTPAVVAAGSPLSRALTLQDAIAMGQKQGPAADAARSIRDAARERNDAFNARLHPQLVLDGQAANLNHGFVPIPLPDGSTQFVGQSQNQSTIGVSAVQNIPFTGSTLSVGSQVSRIDLFGNQPYQREYQTTPVLLTLQQDLFKPRTFVWDERVQSLSAIVAERQYYEAREDVAGEIAGAFFDLYSAQMTLDNAAANASVNDTLYTLNKGRYEVGKIGENDLLNSELQLLRARASVDDAKLQRDRAEAALRRLIVYPADLPLSIVTPDSIPTIDADPDVAVREALKNASAVRQNDLDKTVSQRGITEAKLNNRFNATISASVGFNQTSSVFGRSYDSPLGKQSLIVGVNMPMIQWGAGHSDVEAAHADDQRVNANNKSRTDALAEDARFSALGLAQAQRAVVLSAKADTVALKQFDVAENRYVIGKISISDLYIAQSAKDAAVLAYVQSLRNYWTSYYHLRRATLYDFEKKQELADEREK